MKIKKLLEALSKSEKEKLCHEIQIEPIIKDVRSILKEDYELKKYSEQDIRRIAENYLIDEEIGRERFYDETIKNCIDNYDFDS